MALIELRDPLLQSEIKMLLRDRNTAKNIIWATKDYDDFGFDYLETCEMSYESVINLSYDIFQPRVTKDKDIQKSRTKDKAEVFTPSSICNYMNSYFDEDYFLSNSIVKGEDFEVDKKGLKKYVCLRKLEITCGEAPFIVSRYDSTTGIIIPLYSRVGFIDRKLSLISEFINDESEWLDLVTCAYESSYGYEYQGDNLFKARLNLFYTFIDYYIKKWNKFPENSELKSIANIISRNLWQMDGLTYTTPYTDIMCKVYNWRSKKNMNLVGVGSMKFDFVVGNPPYQESIDNTSDKPIYNEFMDRAYELGDKVMLITPGRFLFNAGKTPKSWNEKMLNDEHLKVSKYWANSKEVFSGVEINGGVAITYRDSQKNFGKIGFYTQFEELRTILSKVMPFLKNNMSLDSIIYSQNKYDLKTLFEEHPNIKEKLGSEGKEKRLVSSCFERIEVFHTDKEMDTDIHILGIVNGNKRKYMWINKKYIEKHPNLEKYKVILPCSNGSGAIGEVLSSPFVGEPLVGYTQSFIGIGGFDTFNEAENAMKYIKSKFCRTMLGILKVTPNNTSDKWRYVPIQDFTENSDIIWSVSISEIDKQLYKKYGLDDKEIAFIEEKVKEME